MSDGMKQFKFDRKYIHNNWKVDEEMVVHAVSSSSSQGRFSYTRVGTLASCAKRNFNNQDIVVLTLDDTVVGSGLNFGFLPNLFNTAASGRWFKAISSTDSAQVMSSNTHTHTSHLSLHIYIYNDIRTEACTHAHLHVCTPQLTDCCVCAYMCIHVLMTYM
jgi:hypothetical protein